MAPRPHPKTVPGNTVSTKVSFITHDAARIYGVQWRSKKIRGRVISSTKRVPAGSSRNQTFVTAEWYLPTRVVVKELSGRVVDFVHSDGAADGEESETPSPLNDDPTTPAPPANTNEEATTPSTTNTTAHSFTSSTSNNPSSSAYTPSTTTTATSATTAASVVVAAQNSDAGSTTDTDTSVSLPVGESVEFIAHGRKWIQKDNEMTDDINGSVPSRTWYMIDEFGDRIGQHDKERVKCMTPLDVFLLMFPPTHLLKIITLTNDKLRKIGKKATTKGEIAKFFGILLLATRYEFCSRRDLWSSRSISRFVEAPKFGQKTGMSRHRFDELWQTITFSNQPAERPDEMSSEEYRWKRVDDFVEAFNEYRQSNYHPSDWICVDESISRWYGLGGHWINIGLPLYVAMDRKPENGAEIQDCCDGRSKIMLRLRLVKGVREDERQAAAAAAAGEGEDQDGLHGTRVMKELVSPWKNTNRIIAADSYFTSVPCVEVMSNLGLRMIGVVKTATRQYPMGYLQNVELPQKGDYKALVNIDSATGKKMLALVWVDRERRYFLSNCSNITPGTPYSRIRWRQQEDVELNIEPDRVEVTIAQPKVCETYYRICPKIDQNNRSRQANLKLERKLHTKDWSMRLNLSILAIIMVDCWNFISGVLESEVDMNENDFYVFLAEGLIENNLDSTQRQRRDRNNSSNYMPSGSSPLHRNDGSYSSGLGCHLTPTKRRKKDKPDQCFQHRCAACGRKTTHGCSICLNSEDAQKQKKAYFCHTRYGRECFADHIMMEHS